VFWSEFKREVERLGDKQERMDKDKQSHHVGVTIYQLIYKAKHEELI